MRLSGVALVLVLAQCQGFLDKEPRDEVSREVALRNTNNVRVAVVGVYSRLTSADYYKDFPMLMYPEAAGGNLRPAPGALARDRERLQPFYEFELTATTAMVENSYQALYRVVHQANDIIAAVPELPDGTATEKDHLLGEALALRGLAHFDLLRLFAQPYGFSAGANHPGVVLATRPVGAQTQLARGTVAEGYALAAADLERALLLLAGYAGRSDNPASWLTPQAVRGLLARVYLYEGNYGRVVTLTNELIGQASVELVSSGAYATSWQPLGTHPETIFQVDMANSTNGGFAEVVGVGFDRPAATVTADLLALYDSTDVRRGLLVTDAAGRVLTRKFPFVFQRVNNVPVVRLSDVYLMRAEALAALGREAPARADLNLIRLRGNPAAAPFTEGGAALRDEIFRERRRELALEGHALFDLTRQGRNLVRTDCAAAPFVCNRPFPDNRFVMPIPERQLLLNDRLTQNPGY